MTKTTQLNIRISKSLLSEIDIISRILGVNRSEWIKVKFSELVHKAKSNYIRKIEQEYITEKIDDKAFERTVGCPPTKQLVLKRMSSKDAAKNVIKEILRRNN
jgi:hypothetical protein